MSFFTTAVSTMSTLVVALGGGVGVWGVVNLMEGYGADNPASKSSGRSPTDIITGAAKAADSGSSLISRRPGISGTGSLYFICSHSVLNTQEFFRSRR